MRQKVKSPKDMPTFADDAKALHDLLSSRWERKQHKTLYRWDSVDWTKNDSEIAKLLGCSREAVRVWRKKTGMPPSPHKGKSGNDVRWESVDWTRHNYEIAKSVGRSHQYISKMRSQLGKPKAPCDWVKSKYDWSSMDWLLPNKEIASILGCSEALVSQHRKRKGMPRPLLDLRFRYHPVKEKP
jgi:hypothetical protein